MTIKMDWGNALMGGLLAGIAGYAQEKGQEKRDATIAEREQELQRMKATSAAATERAKQAMARPVVSSYDDMDEQGNPIKKTIKQTFDPNANGGQGGWTETALGAGPAEAKPPVTRNVIDGSMESTQQWNPKTKTWDAIGAPGPRFNPQVSGDGISAAARDFTFYNSLSPDEQSKYDRMRRGTDPDAPEKKADMKAREETTSAVRDLSKMDQYDRNAALAASGVATNTDHALDTYRANTLYNNQTTMGVKPFKSVSGGTGTSAPQASQAPSDPNKPSVESIMAEANAAIKRGAPQAAVEAKMRQIMQQYGYQPQQAGP